MPAPAASPTHYQEDDDEDDDDEDYALALEKLGNIGGLTTGHSRGH